MENALLYTFSTIAQALGGAFALIAAFVLYRFQSLYASMFKDADVLEVVFKNDSQKFARHLQFLIEDRYSEILSSVESEESWASMLAQEEINGRNRLRAALLRLKHSIGKRAPIMRSFVTAGCTTVAVLVFSVGVIPFAHILCGCRVWAWAILGIGWLGFTACVILYGLVIRRSMD